MDRLTETEGLLAELVAFPTVSAESNLELIAWADDRLGRLGARTRAYTDPTHRKANLLASFGPEGDGGLVLSGHTDVVPVEDQAWTSDPFALTERDGRLHARGACDMKGFLACVLAAAPDFAARPLSRPLHIALTHDEEVGCLGAQALARDLRREGLRPSAAIIGEPTSMRVVEGHKGCREYTTRFTGLEGHGSRPDRGVNAVAFAVRYAARLMEIAEALRARAPEDSRFEPPWTTLNLGRLAGGRVHNVIPGAAELDWEMRPVAEPDAAFALAEIDRFAEETLLPEMRALAPAAAIRRDVVGEVEALTPAEENEARRLVAALTGRNDAGLAAFATGAGVFAGLGMACVVCGPGDIAQAHMPDEYVARDQLAQCLAMLEGLARRLAA